MQRHRSQRSSQDIETVLRDCCIRSFLRNTSYESLAGNSRFPTWYSLRICILQDRIAKADYAYALRQQHMCSNPEPHTGVQGRRNIYGHTQPMGILEHICSEPADCGLLNSNPELYRPETYSSARSRVSSLPTSISRRSSAHTPYMS